MAQAGDFCPEESTMAVGSRRSWEAAFGDKTIDETTSVIGQGRGQSTLDVQGVLTSSRKTAVTTKVSHYHLMPLVLGALCPGDRSPLISRLHIPHSFVPAATAGDEQVAGHEQPSISPEELLEQTASQNNLQSIRPLQFKMRSMGLSQRPPT